MKTIEVNNGRKINMELNGNGLKVENFGSTESFIILDHEIIMLINYYCNCKK